MGPLTHLRSIARLEQLGGCLTVVALFYESECLMESEQRPRPHVEHEVDESAFNCFWLIFPPGEMDIEGLEGLSTNVVETLYAYGFRAKALGIKIVTHPDGEKAFGIPIRLAANTFVSPEVPLND
jgi:hypothetical protein